MSSSLKTLGIERLTVEERISLAEEIWDSLAEATPLTEARRLELDRRLEDHESNPDDVVPWETVKASIATRLER
ncbi:MAG: addiction module protein [Burkholderiales bacterium]|nr:addiction module protein [Burkholderiales bacterium]